MKFITLPTNNGGESRVNPQHVAAVRQYDPTSCVVYLVGGGAVHVGLPVDTTMRRLGLS